MGLLFLYQTYFSSCSRILHSSKSMMKRTTPAQKIKFSIKDLFSKCDQIRSLLKKSLMKTSFFVQWTCWETCQESTCTYHMEGVLHSIQACNKIISQNNQAFNRLWCISKVIKTNVWKLKLGQLLPNIFWNVLTRSWLKPFVSIEKLKQAFLCIYQNQQTWLGLC